MNRNKTAITIDDWKALLLSTIKEDYTTVEAWEVHVVWFPGIEAVQDKLETMIQELKKIEARGE